METTKLSTKGQIVIPEEIRKEFDVGTSFVVSRKEDLIVLKKIKGLTKEEQKEIKELDKAWKSYEKGEFTTMEADAFLEELKKW